MDIDINIGMDDAMHLAKGYRLAGASIGVDPERIARNAIEAIARLGLTTPHARVALAAFANPLIRTPVTHPPVPLKGRISHLREVLPLGARWDLIGMCGPRVGRLLRRVPELHAVGGMSYYIDADGRGCLWWHVWAERDDGSMVDPTTSLAGVPSGAFFIGHRVILDDAGATVGPVEVA